MRPVSSRTAAGSVRPVQRVLLTAAALVLATPSVAGAQGEPIMPLDQVRPGLRCEGASVLRGTTISTFAVEVLDVVRGDSAAEAPRILFRASGPVIEPTGIGPGFSGSPIRCPDDQGVVRSIGAISEGIGEYGGLVGLATPIESILGEPVEPPRGARADGAMLRRARPLAAPLSISGVTGPMATLLRRAAAKAGRTLFVAPGGAFRAAPGFPVQDLVPGAAVSVGYASGAIDLGAVGTVAYRDGDRVWAFGHPLDGVGRRALMLQDAYIYTVVNNPTGSAELSTYKLGTAGHDLGTLTNDANSAVVGRLGALPTRIPLKVVAHDLDAGRVRTQLTQVADETDLGLPAGGSALSLAAATAVGNAALVTLSGAPARQSGSMCLRVQVRERTKPLRFCNTYVGGGPGPNAAVLGDVSNAMALLDAFELGPLHVTAVEANLKLRRSYPQAYLLKATAPEVVRRGRTVKVRLSLRRARGARLTRTISVRVPSGMPRGLRRLQLDGTGPDGGGGIEEALETVLELEDGSEAPSDGEPRTVNELAEAFADLGRYDGITTRFLPLEEESGPEEELAELLGESGGELPPGPEGVAQRPRETYRDPALRIGGTATVLVDVR